MKKIFFLIAMISTINTGISQEIELNTNGQMDIILEDSIGPGIQGPIFKSWEVGVNYPFASPDNFSITRHTINFGLFTWRSAFLVSDSTLFVGMGVDDPFAKVHIDYVSLGNSDRPALQVGEFAGSEHGYMTINKPTEDKNSHIAKFRDDGTTIVNINKGNHAYQLDVNGDIQADNIMNASDAALKTKIGSIPNGLQTLNELKPRSYFLKKDYLRANNQSPVRQFGFVAQEIKQVLPNLVKGMTRIDDHGEEEKLLAVNYIGLIPVLVAANQELSRELDKQVANNTDLNKKYTELLNRLEKLENTLIREKDH